jgi:ERCC4-type nuclease
MQLVIDERETHLYEKLCTLGSSPEITLKKQVLPLADIILLDKEDRELLMIERKSLADLLASIKDGRYEEQSFRLIQSSGHIPHYIIYVIEGMMSQLRSPQEKKMVYSAMTTLSLMKGFSVIRTTSVQETAEWLLAMSDKVARDIAKGRSFWKPSTVVSNETDVVQSYCSVVKKVKKDNIVPANIGEILLCQIPSISTVSALAIMEKFGSIGHLIDQLRSDPACLEGITCTTNGKTRKLSKTIAENVRTYLLYSKPSTEVVAQHQL